VHCARKAATHAHDGDGLGATVPFQLQLLPGIAQKAENAFVRARHDPVGFLVWQP